jgi:hypothetical protein
MVARTIISAVRMPMVFRVASVDLLLVRLVQGQIFA